MRYGIIVNPTSGTLSADRKETVLKRAAAKLGRCRICGLETTSSVGFREAAKNLAGEVDVLIVAGGDGTLSDVINTVDLDRVILAHIPIGSGNAFGCALNLPKVAEKIALRIKTGMEKGRISSIDLIGCGQKKAIMSSVGNDGRIMHESKWYKSAGIKGLLAYSIPTAKHILSGRKFNSEVTVDGRKFAARNMFSLIITKHPFYGGGLRMVPGARINDGNLHLACIDSRMDKLVYVLIKAFRRIGGIERYTRGKRIRIVTDTPQYLQTDGEAEKERRNEFLFEVLPGKLKFVS